MEFTSTPTPSSNKNCEESVGVGQSSDADVKPEAVSADVSAEATVSSARRKRKYTKRTAEEKNSKQTICEWKDISQHNKVVVSMNTAIFQQDVVIRQANGTFMRNFGFTNSTLMTPVDSYVNKLGAIEPAVAMGIPFRNIIGDTRLTMDLDYWTPPAECPTSNAVLTNVMHSIASGTYDGFYCTLVDSCNRPMFCYLQCTPILANEPAAGAGAMKTAERGHRAESAVAAAATAAVQVKVQNTLWAVLTIHCASQIGCAIQFGMGHGLRAHQTYSTEVFQAFKLVLAPPDAAAAKSDPDPDPESEAGSGPIGRTNEAKSLRDFTSVDEDQDDGRSSPGCSDQDHVLSLENPCPVHLRRFGNVGLLGINCSDQK